MSKQNAELDKKRALLQRQSVEEPSTGVDDTFIRPQKKQEVTRYQLNMPSDLHYRLRIKAAEERTTMAALILDAIHKQINLD